MVPAVPVFAGGNLGHKYIKKKNNWLDVDVLYPLLAFRAGLDIPFLFWIGGD
jgi:hypothetical protein